MKLVSIIVISLVLVNLLVTMLTPLVEQFVPEDIIRPIMFAVFFTLFLGITVPVLLTKVPCRLFRPGLRLAGYVRLRKKRFIPRPKALSNGIILMMKLNRLSPRFFQKRRWNTKSILFLFLPKSCHRSILPAICRTAFPSWA